MPARAEKLYCSGFATSIVEMERSQTKPPGRRNLDRYLRYLYAEQCVLKPTRTRAAEYWYRADGRPAPAGNLCLPDRGGYYNPREAKLCGTALCDIRKECRNNECLSPYKQGAAPKPK